MDEWKAESSSPYGKDVITFFFILFFKNKIKNKVYT